MNWNWLQLRPNDGWTVVTEQPLHTAEIGVLSHLYQPIVGVESIGLYVTLCLQVDYHAAGTSDMHTHRYLMGLVGMPLDRLLEARHRLEAVGLLKVLSIKEEIGNSYVYRVLPPLRPEAFFRTDVLAITLLNRIGKEQYKRLKERFNGEDRQSSLTESGEDITKKFDEVFTTISPSELIVHEDSESKQLIETIEPVPAQEQAAALDFSGHSLDWEFLTAQSSAVGSIEHLSVEERAKIEEWAFFYQLGDIELSKALQNPGLYDADNKLQLEKLHAFIRQEYRYRYNRLPDIREVSRKSINTEHTTTSIPGERGERHDPAEVHRQWLMKLSPLELLERYHRGGKVPHADIELVESLREEYGLPNGVINVLIEFVLRTKDFKLPSDYVKKVAGNWKRANLKTVEEAQAFALKQLVPSQAAQTQRRRPANKHAGGSQRAKVENRLSVKSRPVNDAERHEWQGQFNALLKKLRETGAREQKQ